MDPQLLSAIAAICVFLLTLVFYLIYRRSRAARRCVLVTGVCGSGKTLLFARLIHNKFVNSHTSISENVDEYETEKGPLVIVDIPGHERLRDKHIEQYKKSARALIYIVDSSTFQKEIQDVAEYLYILLTDAVIATNCRRVLIFCNKQDVPLSKGVTLIKQLLEKELNTVRMTKASQLTSTDDSENKTVPLGRGVNDQDFEFSHCTNYTLEFAQGYSLNSEDSSDVPYDLTEVEKWLNAVA